MVSRARSGGLIAHFRDAGDAALRVKLSFDLKALADLAATLTGFCGEVYKGLSRVMPISIPEFNLVRFMYASAQSYFRRVAENFTLLSELCPIIDQAAEAVTAAARKRRTIVFF